MDQPKTPFILNISDNAVNRIKQLIQQENNDDLYLRVSVDGGGCSGFQYNYSFISSYDNEDFVAEKDGVKVIIDPVSQQFMNKCTIDFIMELGTSYFAVKNPNATEKCGCGNSFAI